MYIYIKHTHTYTHTLLSCLVVSYRRLDGDEEDDAPSGEIPRTKNEVSEEKLMDDEPIEIDPAEPVIEVEDIPT